MCSEARFNPQQIWYHQRTLLGAQDTRPEDEDLSVRRGDGRVGRGGVLPMGPVLQQGTRGTSQDPLPRMAHWLHSGSQTSFPTGSKGRAALSPQEALGHSGYLGVNPLVLDGLGFTEQLQKPAAGAVHRPAAPHPRAWPGRDQGTALQPRNPRRYVSLCGNSCVTSPAPTPAPCARVPLAVRFSAISL